jgi:hypothetical protein
MTFDHELLETEELELVNGGWFAFFAAAAARPSAKDASRQYEELPAGWSSGMTAAPHQPT